MFATARRTAWTSAATMASRRFVPAAPRPARRGPVAAIGRRRRRPSARPGAGDRPGGGDRPARETASAARWQGSRGRWSGKGWRGERGGGGGRRWRRNRLRRQRRPRRHGAGVTRPRQPGTASAEAAASHGGGGGGGERAVVAAARRRWWRRRGGGGGGRRSDIALKHDIALLGHLDNGLGFYRFSYNGSDKAYVGVMAQEVQTVMPDAVIRGRDGYLRVFYDKLGLQFQTYDQWIASGARIPSGASGSN